MTHADHILVERHDGFQTLTFNRPEKRNAITSPMYQALHRALDNGEADRGIAAHILLGQPGVFTAGNDISEFKDYAEGDKLDTAVDGFLKRIATLRKPLVAGIDGLCIGIGTTLLLHCDLVIASARSTFRTPFLDLGLVPEAASSLLAPRRMGHVRAFELLCMGKKLKADWALAAGLINEIVPESEVKVAALAAGRHLADRPPEALAAARRLLKGDPAEILARIDEEDRLFADRLRSPEAKEAFEAFMQKRPADFKKLKTG